MLNLGSSVETVNWSVKCKQPAGSTLRSDWLRQELHYVTSHFRNQRTTAVVFICVIYTYFTSVTCTLNDYFFLSFQPQLISVTINLIIHHSRCFIDFIFESNVCSVQAEMELLLCWIFVLLVFIFLKNSLWIQYLHQPTMLERPRTHHQVQFWEWFLLHRTMIMKLDVDCDGFFICSLIWKLMIWKPQQDFTVNVWLDALKHSVNVRDVSLVDSLCPLRSTAAARPFYCFVWKWNQTSNKFFLLNDFHKTFWLLWHIFCVFLPA